MSREPGTEAGRRLLRLIPDNLFVEGPDDWVNDILAIEAEARAAERTETGLREALRAITSGAYDSMDECRWCNGDLVDDGHSNTCPAAIADRALDRANIEAVCQSERAGLRDDGLRKAAQAVVEWFDHYQPWNPGREFEVLRRALTTNPESSDV